MMMTSVRNQIIYFILFTVTLLFACSDEIPEWRAASEARDYYDCLAKDDVKGFMKGKAGFDNLPSLYREQLQKAVEQYLSDVKAKHGGLSSVRVSDEHYLDDLEACRDTSLHLTYAFLILCYGDSTQEEIMVPMIERGGQWLMK